MGACGPRAKEEVGDCLKEAVSEERGQLHRVDIVVYQQPCRSALQGGKMVRSGGEMVKS